MKQVHPPLRHLTLADIRSCVGMLVQEEQWEFIRTLDLSHLSETGVGVTEEKKWIKLLVCVSSHLLDFDSFDAKCVLLSGDERSKDITNLLVKRLGAGKCFCDLKSVDLPGKRRGR